MPVFPSGHLLGSPADKFSVGDDSHRWSDAVLAGAVRDPVKWLSGSHVGFLISNCTDASLCSVFLESGRPWQEHETGPLQEYETGIQDAFEDSGTEPLS